MNQKQDSWDGIVQSWHADDEEIAKQLPSEEALITQINKQKRDNKIEVTLSMLASIGLTGFISFEMYAGLPSLADTILYSVFLALGVSCGVYAFISARRSISASTDSAKSHVAVLLEQSKNNLKNMLFARAIGAIVWLIVLFLFGTIVFVALNKTLEFKHYLVGGIALVCCLVCAVMSIVLKKQKIQLENQIAFLSSFED